MTGLSSSAAAMPISAWLIVINGKRCEYISLNSLTASDLINNSNKGKINIEEVLQEGEIKYYFPYCYTTRPAGIGCLLLHYAYCYCQAY
jgi:hypothetical protein